DAFTRRMRPKVVIIVLLVAAAFLAVVLLVPSARNRPDQSASAIRNADSNSVRAAQLPVAVSAPPAIARPVPTLAETNHAEYVRKRNAELMALAMNNDSASLETILSELRNPDRQIRKGALD